MEQGNNSLATPGNWVLLRQFNGDGDDDDDDGDDNDGDNDEEDLRAEHIAKGCCCQKTC